MAEALLQARLAERGTDVRVGSAGLLSGGSPPTEPAIEAMAKVGLDISGHVSRQVSPWLIDETDLVITMTRQHLIDLALMVPEALPRMFQLVDLVQRGEQHGPRQPGESLAEWLAAVGTGRGRADILAARMSDDVADPIGQSAGVYERTRRQLDDLFSRLATLL
jgi:protein-tyrosine phosphatase